MQSIKFAMSTTIAKNRLDVAHSKITKNRVDVVCSKITKKSLFLSQKETHLSTKK